MDPRPDRETMGMANCIACGAPLPRRERGQRYCSRRCFHSHPPPRPPDPTPAEIAARAALIRAGWTEAERVKRLRVDWRDLDWKVPLLHVSELQGLVATE